MPKFFKPSLFPLGILKNSAFISLTFLCYKLLPYVETMYLILIKNKKVKIKGLTPFQSTGHTVAEVVICWPLTMDYWIQPQANPCGICTAQSDTGTGFLRVLWFHPIRIIPQMCHGHSFIYH
jgi:hypothetical protein